MAWADNVANRLSKTPSWRCRDRLPPVPLTTRLAAPGGLRRGPGGGADGAHQAVPALRERDVRQPRGHAAHPFGVDARLPAHVLPQGGAGPPGPRPGRARPPHHRRRPGRARGLGAPADLDGALQRAGRDRRPPGALRPGVVRALLAVPLRGPPPAAPGAGAAGRDRPAGRRGHLPRPLRPPGHADRPRPGPHGRGLRRPARRRRPPRALGRAGGPRHRARLARVHERRRAHPHRHPGPPLLRPGPAQHPAHPVGLLGRRRPRPPDLPQRRHRLLPRLRRDRRAVRSVRRHDGADRRLQRVLARHPHDPGGGPAGAHRSAGRRRRAGRHAADPLGHVQPGPAPVGRAGRR